MLAAKSAVRHSVQAALGLCTVHWDCVRPACRVAALVNATSPQNGLCTNLHQKNGVQVVVTLEPNNVIKGSAYASVSHPHTPTVVGHNQFNRLSVCLTLPACLHLSTSPFVCLHG
jgi:hypothetical protein